MKKLDPSEAEPEPSEQSSQRRWWANTRLKNFRLHSPTWLSVLRPDVLMVERYLTQRVLLAGDAARVYTPAGVQGLNTGMQDAWNLGLKLALVLRGAFDVLLPTCEEERMTVVSRALELSTALFNATTQRTFTTRLSRGDQERQLRHNYRGCSLAGATETTLLGKALAGDRAQDALCAQIPSDRISQFDRLRRGHLTVPAFSAKGIANVRSLSCPNPNPLRIVPVLGRSEGSEQAVVVDDRGHARKAYGVGEEEDLTVVVRPDSPGGHLASDGWRNATATHMARLCGSALRRDALTAAGASPDRMVLPPPFHSGV